MPRHKLLVIIILAALAVTAAIPAGAQARRSIKGPGYKTYVPSGWKLKHQKSGSWRLAVASPGGRSGLTMSVTIGTIGARSLAKQLRVKQLPANPAQLVQVIAPLPPGATNAQIAGQPQTSTLAGAVSGILGVHFDLRNQGTLMTLTAVRRGNRVYLVDIQGADNLALLGRPAVTMVTDSWRWT
jgi:hypothetical protein